MNNCKMSSAIAMLIVGVLAPISTDAQVLGTFRWRTEPFCNVLNLTVTQSGAAFTLDGFDDACGRGARHLVNGIAVPQLDGTISLGLNIVHQGEAPVVVVLHATISPATISGTWVDEKGNSGPFVFNPAGESSALARGFGASTAIPPSFSFSPNGAFAAVVGTQADPIPASGPGSRMMWHAAKSAFRAGRAHGAVWDDANVGGFSTAFGLDTTASGQASFAAGRGTTASGNTSLAIGVGNLASGFGSMAFGLSTQASGQQATTLGGSTLASGALSLAMGDRTIASGHASVATGVLSRASGEGSFATGKESGASATAAVAAGLAALATGDVAIALGSQVQANAANTVVLGTSARANVVGSFVFGDASTGLSVFAPAAHSFTVRASGGAKFFSNSAMSLGVSLPENGGAWASISDVNLKENFRDLDGDEVLSKLARMPIREWSYKAQGGAIRHAGPTAQDFHSAFGLGEDPLRIGTIDADGIALRAIQALEARTREANDTLTCKNEALKAALAVLQGRLERLEQLSIEKR